MDSNTGKITAKPLDFEGARGMRSFSIGEVIQTKGCYFEITGVKPDPDNTIIMRGVPKKLGKERFKKQSF